MFTRFPWMDRQTLRDWVQRDNDEGVAGLLSIRTGGRQALLTPAQMAELKDLAIKGPDPETDNVVRCVDLCAQVARRFTVTVSEGTMGKWLRKAGRKSARRWPRTPTPWWSWTAPAGIRKLGS